MARVDVIVLNWNGLHYLRPCLNALSAQTFTDFQIWIVDNGSTDGSVAFVQAQYPQARLIVNTTNRGFAEANNQAIRAGAAEYVVTLNNDTAVEPGWLQAMVDAIDTHPQAGMCASKMLFTDRPAVVNSAGIAVDRAGMAWDRLGGQPDQPEESKAETVFGACAGAALYRRTMLEEIGLFDEDFFAYLEDVDLAWRAQWAGWSAIYAPQARLYHHHSATSSEGSLFKNYLLGRNKVWLIAKNYPALHLLAYGPLIVLYDLAAVAFAVVKRRDLNPLRGRLAGLRRLPEMLRRRRPLVRRSTPDDVMRLLAPIEPPWRVLDRYRHIQPAKPQSSPASPP